MAASVNASVTTFDTTDPSVPVSARCAPITSLFMRLISAPVCVRVKNAIGMRCVWSNSERRRSKIRPSPIFADHHRSPSDSNASPSAIATMSSASVVTMPLSCCGMAVSMMRLISSGGTMPTSASSTMVTRNATQHHAVGPGEAPHRGGRDARSRCAPRTDAGSVPSMLCGPM